jgi:hypothetical protein
MAVDPRNFLLNTDYPVDQIIWLWEGTHTVSTGLTYLNVDHDLPFTPLPKATWSTTSDYETTYSTGDGTLSSDGLLGLFDIQTTQTSANSTRVQVPFVKTSAGSQLIYARLWGYMPSDVNVDIDPTAIAGDTFSFNTDYNYCKLLDAGKTASSGVASSSEIIVHGLGYYPQVEVWSEKNSEIYTLAYTIVVNGTADYSNAELDTNELTLTRAASLPDPEAFHYRVYADEL